MAEAHLAAVFVSVVAILYADYYGGQWFRGRVSAIPEKTVERMHAAVAIGLAALLLTGGLMAIDRWGYLSQLPAFWAKMGFVATLTVNGFFIGRISHLATTGSFADLSARDKRFVIASATVSAISWVGAIIGGLLIA